MSQASDPSSVFYAVTPNDSQNIHGENKTRGIYIGGTGDLSIVGDSATVTFTGVPAGTVLPIRTKRIRATGTTATNIIALF